MNMDQFYLFRYNTCDYDYDTYAGYNYDYNYHDDHDYAYNNYIHGFGLSLIKGDVRTVSQIPRTRSLITKSF